METQAGPTLQQARLVVAAHTLQLCLVVVALPACCMMEP